MLRTSSYTIYVDLPGNREEMLLVHGYSGAYDKVSCRVATYLRALEARRPPKPLYGDWAPEIAEAGEAVAPSAETVAVLRRRGYLTEMTLEAEEELFSRVVHKIHALNMQQVPTYLFMPTYDCNLRCAYCFQDHMRTQPRFGHLLRRMSPEAVDTIVAALPRVEALHGLEPSAERHRSIGFFGGEPLLAANRSIVETIMAKTAGLGPASYWAITNATELDAYRDLLVPGGLDALQVTLDGPPEEHDQRRVYPDGGGSFARIARHITMALDQGVAVSVRLNLDRANLAHLPRLADVILAQGWSSHPRFSVYTAAIQSHNDHTDPAGTFDTWSLDQALVALGREHPSLAAIERPDDAIKGHARRLFAQPDAVAPNFKESFCSAHTRMYIFDAFCDIYACWDRTGDPTVRIGRISPGGEVTLNAQVNELWRSRTVASNPVCRRCRYALHCGGGCAVLAAARTGRHHANFCDGFASRFRANVAEAYLDHVAGAPLAGTGGRICDQ